MNKSCTRVKTKILSWCICLLVLLQRPVQTNQATTPTCMFLTWLSLRTSHRYTHAPIGSWQTIDWSECHWRSNVDQMQRDHSDHCDLSASPRVVGLDWSDECCCGVLLVLVFFNTANHQHHKLLHKLPCLLQILVSVVPVREWTWLWMTE